MHKGASSRLGHTSKPEGFQDGPEHPPVEVEAATVRGLVEPHPDRFERALPSRPHKTLGKIERRFPVPTGLSRLSGSVALAASLSLLHPLQVRSELPPGTFNVQVQAIEVTQGVRGAIPFRVPPAGSFTIPSDGFEHVANRRTVVRVYGWVEVGAGATVPLLTAHLEGYDGSTPLPESPLAPLVTLVTLQEGTTLQDMRARSLRSWDFLLPDSWIDLPLAAPERTITFRAVVNPPGPYYAPECPGCDSDNTTTLMDQVFRHVLGDRIPQYVIRPIFVRVHYFDGPGSGVTVPPPPFSFESTMLNELDLVYPNATQRSPRLVYPPVVRGIKGTRGSTWGRQIRQFLPGGSVAGVRPGDHWVALFPTEAPLSCAGGNGVPGFVSVDACDLLFRHELAHSQGRLHPGGHEPSWIDPDYPGEHGEVGIDDYGYDLWSDTAYKPRMTPIPGNPEGMLHDYMSGAVAPKWSSLYTWGKLISDIRNNVPSSKRGTHPAPLDGDYVLVTGSIAPDDSVSLDPLVAAFPPQRTIVNTGPCRLEFRDGAGAVLGTHQLPADEGPDGPPEGVSFSEIVFAPTGWTTLAVMRDATSLYEATRSVNPPSVALFDPPPGAQWLTGPQDMQWQAGDPDNDPLWFRPEVSADSGATWIAACAETTGFACTVDLEGVSGPGGTWLVRVQASDGLNWGVSDEVPVTTPNRPPHAVISRPTSDEVFPASTGCPVTLYGSAGDWVDGPLEGQSLSWFVDGQPWAIGAGAEVAGLVAGPHEIVLVAVNSSSQSASDTVGITVIAAMDPPALLEPQPGAEEPGPVVTFCWDGVAGATMYDLQVGLDSQMTTPVIDDQGLPYLCYGVEELTPGETYFWRVRGRDICDTGPWSPVRSFHLGASTGLPDETKAGVRVIATPNPFRSSVRLTLRLDVAGEVTVRVLDVAGRDVATLWRGPLPAGEHSLFWSGTNGRGAVVPSGVYYVVVDALGRALRQALVLTR
jgi:hypothetical protein